MRYGIVSDIHSNLAAFETVLSDMGPVDALWCLGDVVGYGPEPNGCVELLRRYHHLCVMGNHDAAAVGMLDVSTFNPAAARAASWTANVLTDRTRSYLEALPETLTEGDFTIVHGSPREPIWEYLTHADRAAPSFGYFGTLVCLVGHTHVPAIYQERLEGVVGRDPETDSPVQVEPPRFIANPGSVGQPRDHDPRASYAIYDSETRSLEWHRVAYPIEVTQRKMRDAGLPDMLIERLSYGW